MQEIEEFNSDVVASTSGTSEHHSQASTSGRRRKRLADYTLQSESEDEQFDYISAALNVEGMEAIRARNIVERATLERLVAERISVVTDDDIRKQIAVNWAEIVREGGSQRTRATKRDRETAINQIKTNIRRQERSFY